MNAKEYIAYLNSPAGMFALNDAKKLLQRDDPEVDDADLLAQVVAIGFPKWAAVRIFHTCTNRYAPLECRKCQKQFRPRSPFTMDRPVCHQCVIGPKTPEQQMKDKARRLAFSAEGKGKIKRKPCKCGATRNLHMHHPDYSRPLYVIWLCRACHVAEHKNVSREKTGGTHASH